jgi:hypothetical protein
VFDGLAHLTPESGGSAPAEPIAQTGDGPQSAIAALDFARDVAREPAVAAPSATPNAGAAPGDMATKAPAPAADWLRREWKALAVSALLLALLAAQIGLRQRDVLAAEHPELRGILVALCGIVGCEVRLPRAVDRLSIEGDEMIAADPRDPSRVLLVATLRNSAAYPVAYPSLELSLQNAREEILARRVLGPTDYLEAGSDPAGGLAANGDLHLRLALDTGELKAEGYRLFLFYP